MTFFTKLLRILTRTDQAASDVELKRAERTEKTIERYGELVNANARQRQRMSREQAREIEG